MDDYTPILTPEERAARRAQRAAARRERQRRQRRRLLLHILPAAALGLVLVITLSVWGRGQGEEARAVDTAEGPAEAAFLSKPSLLRPEAVFSPRETADTVQLGAEIASSCAVVIDGQSQEILAEKGGRTVISPASMTKVLTLLVAAEQLEEADLDDTFTMTIEITDYCFVNGCSVVGLDIGETVPVRSCSTAPSSPPGRMPPWALPPTWPDPTRPSWP